MIHKTAIVTLTLLIFKEINSLDAPISGAFSYENVILENHVAQLVLDIRHMIIGFGQNAAKHLRLIDRKGYVENQ